MKKNVLDAILRLDDLEEILANTIPAMALSKISELAFENGMKRLSIKLVDYEAVILDEYSDEANELRESNEPFILDMNYSMRVYRKLGKRKAVTRTTLLFTGNDFQAYRITLVNSMEVKSLSREFDTIMFDSCYQYAKEMLEYLPLDMYVSKELTLPEKYQDIASAEKIQYDGYTEYKGSSSSVEESMKGTVTK